MGRARTAIAAIVSAIGDPRLRERLRSFLELAPRRVAIVYALLFVILGKETVEAIYGNADIASAPVIGELYRSGEVVLGFYNWYETVWLEQLTRWMPLHRYLWTYGPWLGSLAAVALVAWSATAVTGRRWAGWTLFAICFSATGALLMWQFAWSGHALAWVHVCLLGSFVVACVRSGGWFAGSLPLHLLVTLLLAAWTAVGYGSDKLVLVAGIIPCAITGALLMRIAPWGTGWRAGLSALAIAGIATALGPPIAQAASESGITGLPFAVTGADASRRAANLDLFWKAGASLLGGDWTGQPRGGRHLLAVASALVAGAALVIGLTHAAFVGIKALRRPQSLRPGLAAFVVYWAFSLGILSGAYVWSTAPLDLASARYLVSAAYAVVALVVVAAAPRAWGRAAAGGALAVIALAGVVSLASHDLRASPYTPTRKMADDVTRVGRLWGVTKAYASYWDAAPLTWLTRNEFHIFPTVNCQPNIVCPFNQQRASDWYRPQPGIKTMVITDQMTAPGQPPLGTTDPAFGEPLAIERTERLVIFVYPHDVARWFGPK